MRPNAAAVIPVITSPFKGSNTLLFIRMQDGKRSSSKKASVFINKQTPGTHPWRMRSLRTK